VTLRIHGLMYHDVLSATHSPSGRSGSGPDRYKLSWSLFLEHLERIEGAVAAAPIAVEHFGEATPPQSWALTFDDGGASALEVGEELARRGWRAYFFVTTGLVGTGGFVDAEAIRAVRGLGHVVGSHSVTHPDRMAALSASELDREWRGSVEALSDILGEEVRSASVPGGHYRRPVALAAARAGIATLFTSEPVRTARRVGSCLVLGRYSIRADTSAEVAAHVAAGHDGPWLRQYVAWNLKKPAKMLAAEPYDVIRRTVLARSAASSRD